ncbi:universal stress protein [Amycolatopsis sp. NPDC059657]|uniref:universal stress protein n=1 Tax=Amycolatopsis sp. NPDC059657 TaxID=3346899 RepID=UPI00366AFDD2
MPDNPLYPIVVGADGSVAATCALRWAAAEAAASGRALRIVHVVDLEVTVYPRYQPAHYDLREMELMRGHRLLREAREVVRETASEVIPELRLDQGKVAEALREESRAASLLVLGGRQPRPLDRIAVGSVVVALAAHARCPVVVVRVPDAEDLPPTEGPVVVGVDHPPSSEEALEIAFEEAARRGARLIAVHSWDDHEINWPLDQHDVETHEDDLLAQRLAFWQVKYPDVAVERRIARGRPADRLLDLADQAQLIVVGSRGRGGLKGLLLGSTSQTVLSHALCPVLVARSGEKVR